MSLLHQRHSIAHSITSAAACRLQLCPERCDSPPQQLAASAVATACSAPVVMHAHASLTIIWTQQSRNPPIHSRLIERFSDCCPVYSRSDKCKATSASATATQVATATATDSTSKLASNSNQSNESNHQHKALNSKPRLICCATMNRCNQSTDFSANDLDHSTHLPLHFDFRQRFTKLTLASATRSLPFCAAVDLFAGL